MTWDVILRPDEHTPYAGTNLLMRISIPSEYAWSALCSRLVTITTGIPSSRPKSCMPCIAPQYSIIDPCSLATPVFHPNVHARSGDICLDILTSAWSPAWSLQSRACISVDDMMLLMPASV